ncbi:hypothetical protein [Dietzia sp. 179-F 9C3 NHS]|uniref:hypothetical protein n=1 Tax=Dietzia sp. 179-F 9C3 NHS TaxID=3374295 RepID=UPI00387A2768
MTATARRPTSVHRFALPFGHADTRRNGDTIYIDAPGVTSVFPAATAADLAALDRRYTAVVDDGRWYPLAALPWLGRRLHVHAWAAQVHTLITATHQ